MEGGRGKEEVGVASQWPWLRPLSQMVETGVEESVMYVYVCILYDIKINKNYYAYLY